MGFLFKLISSWGLHAHSLSNFQSSVLSSDSKSFSWPDCWSVQEVQSSKKCLYEEIKWLRENEGKKHNSSLSQRVKGLYTNALWEKVLEEKITLTIRNIGGEVRWKVSNEKANMDVIKITMIIILRVRSVPVIHKHLSVIYWFLVSWRKVLLHFLFLR